MINAIVGNNIRKLRERRKLTQAVLGDMADMQQSGLALIESGKANPTLETLDRLAQALGVALPALFNEGGNLEPDYTTLRYFLKGAFPYIGSPCVPEPEQLLDSLHRLVYKRVTLKDIRIISRQYRRSLTYEAVPRRVEGEGGPQVVYDVRLIYRKKELFNVEDEIKGLPCDGEELRRLIRLMQLERASFRHFREILDDFCQNGYQRYGEPRQSGK